MRMMSFRSFILLIESIRSVGIGPREMLNMNLHQTRYISFSIIVRSRIPQLIQDIIVHMAQDSRIIEIDLPLAHSLRSLPVLGVDGPSSFGAMSPFIRELFEFGTTSKMDSQIEPRPRFIFAFGTMVRLHILMEVRMTQHVGHTVEVLPAQ